jgi:hypothetical protein
VPKLNLYLTAEPKGPVADYLLQHVTVTIMVTVTTRTSKEKKGGNALGTKREMMNEK